MSSRTVVAFWAGNLWASAQRGERETKPRRCCSDEVVDLVDDAVDVVAETRALGLDLAMEGQHLVEARDAAHQRVDLESPAPERRHHLGLRAARQRAHLAPGVGEEAQRTRCRDRGVELAQRTRGGVARIGKDLVAGRRLARVDLGEIGMPEIDLAADLRHLRDTLAAQLLRDVGDRERVRGDVLADRAVAAGRGGDELALLIAQAQRQAVDLRLGREDERRLRAEGEEAPDAFDELAHVLLAEAVGERQHRHAMAHLGEFLRGLGADLSGQALRCPKLGKARLERLVALPQRIVFRVRHRRRVLLVIAPVKLGDLTAERVVLGAGVVRSKGVGVGFGEGLGRHGYGCEEEAHHSQGERRMTRGECTNPLVQRRPLRNAAGLAGMGISKERGWIGGRSGARNPPRAHARGGPRP